MRNWWTALVATTACTVPNPLAEAGNADAIDGTGISGSASTSTDTSSTGDTDSSEASSTFDPASSSTGSSESGEPVCPAEHRCVAVPPPGWTGPVVLWLDAVETAIPDCPSTYPNLVVNGGQDLSGTDFTCDCTCGDAQGVTCQNAVLEYHATVATCFTNPTTYSINTVCTDAFAALPANSWFRVPPVQVTGGGCLAASEQTRDDPFYARVAAVCGDAIVAGDCADGSMCAPIPSEPFGTTTCILQEGEHACPEAYPQASLIYRSGFNDDRLCGGCICSAPVGTCSGLVNLYANNNCSNSAGAIPATGLCTQANDPAEAARWVPASPSASCLPSGGEATGEVAPLGPVTVCCAEPPT